HLISHFLLMFFFFQAEDGIRDYKVTGVQTCALPIWRPRPTLNWRRGSRNGSRRDGRRERQVTIERRTPSVPNWQFGAWTSKTLRSEERRVGKECRYRWWRCR